MTSYYEFAKKVKKYRTRAVYVPAFFIEQFTYDYPDIKAIVEVNPMGLNNSQMTLSEIRNVLGTPEDISNIEIEFVLPVDHRKDMKEYLYTNKFNPLHAKIIHNIDLSLSNLPSAVSPFSNISLEDKELSTPRLNLIKSRGYGVHVHLTEDDFNDLTLTSLLLQGVKWFTISHALEKLYYHPINPEGMREETV
jgi:hypothetical protein